MQPEQFQDVLQSIPTMSPEQITVLHKTLPASPDSCEELEASGQSRLLERLKYYFDQNPVCPHCHSESVKRWGTHAGHQRYRCKQCQRTFNALSKSPLAHLRVRDKLDQYLECMDGSTTLRPAAAKCGVSLNTSFHLRHRLMAVVESDAYGQLSGILEEDETFFRESHKGQRKLEVPARKRGGKSARKKQSSIQKDRTAPVKKIPVMVACDRDHHIVDAVLKHVSTEELTSHLSGRIQAGSTMCLDGHMSHDSLAEKLNVTVKTLVTNAGQYVKEGIFHIQTVNAYHSELKRWINGFFNGVATKYLSRYLGWKRFLKARTFSEESFLDQVSIRWAKQHLI